MRLRQLRLLFIVISFWALWCAAGSSPTRTGHPPVRLIRTPNGGIQPQAAVDSAGVVHLVYFKGDDGAGDLYYVRKGPRDADFSKPIRVNSVPGSAVAIGTVRGAQIAMGRGGR